MKSKGLTRRDVLKAAGLAGVTVMAPWEMLFPRGVAAASLGAPRAASLGTPSLTRFIDPLPSAIPVLKPALDHLNPLADYYEVTMRPGSWKFHSQLPKTRLTWGYWGTGVSAGPGGPIGLGYLGPTIEASQDKPVVVKFVNSLTGDHPLEAAIDYTIMGNTPKGTYPIGRATPHLHGGFSSPQFDGHPYSWWAPNGQRDPHWAGFDYPELPGEVKRNEMKVWFSNMQAAAGLWYHDHAFGITRLNAYAGLAAFYFIRDSRDSGKPSNRLRLPAGAQEIPLALQDKQFNADGSLFYPSTNGQPFPDYPHNKWVPEFFGDTPVINATAYPYLTVEPRRYRFRMLNGAQARFFNLSLDSGTPLWVIGMEQGLLPEPVRLSTLLLAPGERADVIVDFTGTAPGTRILLKNDALTPYPGEPGQTTDMPDLMQFRVVPLTSKDLTAPPDRLRLPRLVGSLLPAVSAAPKRQIVARELTYAPTDFPIEVKLNERHFDDPVEDKVKVGSTEVWQWINLTVDAHPMHMHLVKFQVVNRQKLVVNNLEEIRYWTDYSAWIAAGRPAGRQPDVNDRRYLDGPAQPPAPEESGWKDTVKAYPGMVTRTVAKFDVFDPNGKLPESTRLPANYVYHCHILEHEENDMMRPFQVIA
jgi:spore coat protein A